MARAAATGNLAFGLAVARLSRRFRRVGTMRLPDDTLRFNPFNCGGGMRAAGTLNRLRDYAYPLSQRSWTFRRARSSSRAA